MSAKVACFWSARFLLADLDITVQELYALCFDSTGCRYATSAVAGILGLDDLKELNAKFESEAVSAQAVLSNCTLMICSIEQGHIALCKRRKVENSCRFAGHVGNLPRRFIVTLP